MLPGNWLKPLLLLTVLGLGGFLLARPAAASVTIRDMAGRMVTIPTPPQRIALQDGRDAMDLALLDRANPFQRIVVWNNLIKRSQPGLWAVMAKKWPAAANIPDMGFDDNGAVNLEELIASKPQLLIAELRAKPVLEQDGALKTLASLGIPVVFIDDSEHPIPSAAESLLLLGKILDRQPEAQVYYNFYQAHLQALQAVIAKQPPPRPDVFVEALAGQNDANNCCFTHGDFGWGLLVQAVGARNLGSGILHTPSGQVPPEALLARQPNVIVMTGRGPSTAMPGFGFDANPKIIGERMEALEARPGFAELNAVQKDRVYGIYHPFYSSVLNIVALEYLAKFIYPSTFPDLDPAKTYASLIARFTDIPAMPVLLGMQAPSRG